MLELWGMQSATFLGSLRSSLLAGEVSPDKILPMSQIELFKIELFFIQLCVKKNGTDAKLNSLKILTFKLRTQLNCLKWSCLYV